MASGAEEARVAAAGYPGEQADLGRPTLAGIEENLAKAAGEDEAPR